MDSAQHSSSSEVKKKTKSKGKRRRKKKKKEKSGGVNVTAASNRNYAAAASSSSFVSAKKRQKATLTRKMHTLTNAEAKHVRVHRANLGQGKRKIWLGWISKRLDDADAAAKETSEAIRAAYATAPTDASVSPVLEAQRSLAVEKLRKQLVKECGNLAPPTLAMERWLLNALLARDLSGGESSSSPQSDPLMGPICSPDTDLETSSIVDDLVRASIERHQALQIARSIQSSARELMPSLKSSLFKSKASREVHVRDHKHTSDIWIGEGRKAERRLLKLNREHYEKLMQLWKLAGGWERKRGGGESAETLAKRAFHADLYCLLSRYFAMQGHGMQAACHEDVFCVLHDRLDVSFECFASPLNCFYGAFCSAFPDTDARFGSSGSFWKWDPPLSGGSFQANPPFVALIMKLMAEKIVDILKNRDAPLSFTVIVPGWLEDAGYQILSSSQYKRAHWLIAKADHGFCDGAQHQRKDRYRTSPYDTAVLILQNAAGALKYNNTGEETEKQLRAAFAKAIPTQAAAKRRMRDGRGFGDEDGGGGVYQGKKRKRTGEGVVKRRYDERKKANKARRMRKKRTAGVH